MILSFASKRICKSCQIPLKTLPLLPFVASKSSIQTNVERITKIINDHPFPHQSLHPILQNNIPTSSLSKTFVEAVLGRLFAAHSNGLKALELFRFFLKYSHDDPSSDAFEKTLHILVRMRYFEKAWELMLEISKSHPCLLTIKSMSIILSKLAKFGSYEDTLTAFERMEKEIFVGRPFGTEEFNVLLRAICTQREMKEAQSVFWKMYDRFPPNIKTMNILLLGFKESGDITSVDLFFHEMRRRGFQPNNVTFHIRIDAYCKKGYFADALRIFNEMEQAKCQPSLETLTTLVHGAGVARNALKAREIFDEIPRRNLQVDTGAYNALISSLIRCRELKSAASLMAEMAEMHIAPDDMTYHTLFYGFMKAGDTNGYTELYQSMIENNFLPKARTVVMLMKYFCMNQRLDLGLQFWNYLLEKGFCPHGNALHLLVTALCARHRPEEAVECCRQFLERGMRMSNVTYLMLESCLQEDEHDDKLRDLNQMVTKVMLALPPPRGNVLSNPAFVVTTSFKSVQ